MSKQRYAKAPPTWDDTLRRGLPSFEAASEWRYLCRVCRERKYEPEFSIHGIRRGPDGHLLELTCNTCKLAKTRGIFLKDDAPNEWQKSGACVGLDESTADTTFFPVTTEDLSERRWEPFCGGCVVRDQCESYGRQTASYGVWGGVVLYEGAEPKTSPQIESLLASGVCARNHRIESRDDLTIRTNNVTGRTDGACKKCDAEKRRERKENRAKSVMLAA